MELFVIRHADAIPLGQNGISSDEERPLSELGVMQSETVARGLKQRGLIPDLVVSSPLVRAHQMANILVQHWELRVDVAITEALIPDARPKALGKFLGECNSRRVAVVGHLPHLAEFDAWLLGSKKVQVDVRKASVACFSVTDQPRKGLGVLRWLINSDWLA